MNKEGRGKTAWRVIIDKVENVVQVRHRDASGNFMPAGDSAARPIYVATHFGTPTCLEFNHVTVAATWVADEQTAAISAAFYMTDISVETETDPTGISTPFTLKVSNNATGAVLWRGSGNIERGVTAWSFRTPITVPAAALSIKTSLLLGSDKALDMYVYIVGYYL